MRHRIVGAALLFYPPTISQANSKRSKLKGNSNLAFWQHRIGSDMYGNLGNPDKLSQAIRLLLSALHSLHRRFPVLSTTSPKQLRPAAMPGVTFASYKSLVLAAMWLTNAAAATGVLQQDSRAILPLAPTDSVALQHLIRLPDSHDHLLFGLASAPGVSAVDQPAPRGGIFLTRVDASGQIVYFRYLPGMVDCWARLSDLGTTSGSFSCLILKTRCWTRSPSRMIWILHLSTPPSRPCT